MAASDMTNRRHVQLLLTWSTDSSCIPGVLTGYYQLGQLNPGFLASLLLLPLLLFYSGLGPAKTELSFVLIAELNQLPRKFHAEVESGSLAIDVGLRELWLTNGTPTPMEWTRPHPILYIAGIRIATPRWNSTANAKFAWLGKHNGLLTVTTIVKPLVTTAESWHVVPLRPFSCGGWVFGHGLDDDALAILASAKTHIYRYFLGVELRSEDLVWRRTLSRFKAGRISIEDDPRQDAQNVQKITDLIKENPRTTLLELEQDTGISKTTIGRIVTKDLKLKKTPAKFIPRFLTNEQKLCRLATCENMLEMTRTDPEWKDKIITGDETWVYDYDPETKRQYAEWRGQGEPRPKKSRILKSRNKVLLVAFLDNKGIVHHEYLPAGRTVIKKMYLDILRHLREAIRKKMPEKWPNGDWILHHNNARPHTAHLVTSFFG
ncbi:hypothetical protein LAZ67_2005061 [Cordylochernes scorpioides]|uniref:Transposase n=1 Tax=Cordylochernes scorpioides TaxID=51811 RepID=A0ABY6K437_9ARAC|nr:hypothetical protein LAZ67_2005061 [Cordylochernes scorpioides]